MLNILNNFNYGFFIDRYIINIIALTSILIWVIYWIISLDFKIKLIATLIEVFYLSLINLFFKSDIKETSLNDILEILLLKWST